ncbi:MAG: LysR substrate-binding domain-containing protein [Pseudomonadota bacterium]
MLTIPLGNAVPRLPNWKLLTAFEAAARHRSFSRAAAELNVMQPAVSRRVAALEQELSARLLIRSRPNATLTPDGEVLYRALSASLVQVQGAVEQITDRDPDRRVVVNLTIGFASCFLLKRLGAFRHAHPEIELELVSRDLNESYSEDGAHVVIVFEREDKAPGARKRLVFAEEMIAVASPGYLAAGRPSLADLGAHRILKLDASSHADDWSKFLDGSGFALGPRQQISRFNSFMVYLQAALNGDGVAIGWRRLLDDHLASGQLEMALDRVVAADRGYVCCLTRSGARSASACAFQEWLASVDA